MANIKYIGIERLPNKLEIIGGGADITGSLNVNGAILEKGYSIPTLIEKMIVDSASTSILNFTPITDSTGEVLVTN